jgi:hypothetical protein
MKISTATDGPLLITISPGTVYISTNPDQSSYANLVIILKNTGSDILSVNEIAVTLPATLAPPGGLNSISPIASPQNLWNFIPSQFTQGEFDAAPALGTDVQMNPNDVWQFTLQKVTLVSTITTPSANVDVAVTFANGTKFPQSLNVNIDPAVASIVFLIRNLPT